MRTPQLNEATTPMAGTPQTPATALAAAHGAGSHLEANAELTRRLNLVRRMAWLCAALMLATIALSAFMRLSSNGLGCADWPACYGQSAREAAEALVSGQIQAGAGGSTAVAVARVLHRIVASVVLILVITLTLATLATKPRLPREGPLSMALLLLALGLAALGVVTAGATLPAVTVGNLMGGFVMLAPGRCTQAF